MGANKMEKYTEVKDINGTELIAEDLVIAGAYKGKTYRIREINGIWHAFNHKYNEYYLLDGFARKNELQLVRPVVFSGTIIDVTPVTRENVAKSKAEKTWIELRKLANALDQYNDVIYEDILKFIGTLEGE